MEKMKGQDGLKKEIEFETKLRKLLEHYGFSLKHIVNLLDPQTSARGQISDKPASTHKPRELKVYKNPNTGEVIETKGGNHRALKGWKAEHGADVVEGWLKK
ncbi:histone-like nucleoid-structuring protein, MvaT/MvaU family [Pseudomonas syringae]|uniref:histone-like nucleoid-structuring protein, MvaT/MvaU family n=1 Tax=Pseudomonas syringae TaxID=317 RepID=UPI0034D614B7